MTRNIVKHSLTALALFGCSLLLGSQARAQINLSAGDIAIIGWDDQLHRFTIVTLVDLPAGTKIYFTDNGWTGSAFRNTKGFGSGDETLCLFQTSAIVPKGTIITDGQVDGRWIWVEDGSTVP